MRTKTVKIAICLGLSMSLNSMAIDTAREEELCASLGFKPKTPGFGYCVLELLDRKNLPSLQSEDDQTCYGYGFRPGTAEFASCKQQADLARQSTLELTKSRDEVEQLRKEQESARRRDATRQVLELYRFRQEQENRRQSDSAEKQHREVWRANQKAIDESWRRP